MSSDRLAELFELRLRFMEAIKESPVSGAPQWPLDLADKQNQQYIRDIALRGVEEMFEALQHLKNWKPHRQTDVAEFNRDEFLEEIVDAFNYFFELILLAGFSADDFFEMYLKKDRVIHDRLKTGY
jgi:predicted house-cleaning noncanonical NTP pyrophosphatase (MazG superfamily)